MDYNMEREINNRPIHHYVRKERFVRVLNQLLGKCKIDPEVLDECILVRMDSKYIWDDIYDILKRRKKREFNQIPSIIVALGYCRLTVEGSLYDEIIKRFLKIQDNFKKRCIDERKYFPNIRFVILMIMGELGLDFGYDIPLLRTSKKLSDLLLFWNKIS
jgi:hypothetical protein